MLVGAIAVYFFLGGLNSVEISVEEVSDYKLAGFAFKGDGESLALRDGWMEARELIESGKLDGVLTVIHYKDTTLEEGHLRLFMGVMLNEGSTDLSNMPDNYELLTVPASRAVRATIEAHNSVMPNSETIENRILDKAEELGIQLQDFTIEQYLGPNDLWVDMPTKQ